MSEPDDKIDNADDRLSEFLFTELILSFQAAAWQQMGKVPSIVTGKVERNLEMAKHSIDILGMLEEKTKGNISEDETKILQHVLFELRLNYLDELRKRPEAEDKKKDESQQTTEKSEETPKTDSKEN